MLSGFTNEEQRGRPTAARAEHISLDADPKEEHIRLQAYESKPDGPADP